LVSPITLMSDVWSALRAPIEYFSQPFAEAALNVMPPC
jgi:hypothetical protein